MGGVVMAERAMRAAGWLPRHTVQVATRVLPVRTRERYRQEFLAELYGLGRARQLRHAFGVLSRCWALRAAISAPAEAAAADIEIVFPFRRPKRYRVRRNDEGYEIRDADAAGTQVFFSTSRREARTMSRALNRRPRSDEMRADNWKGGYEGRGPGAAG
jgi:hypothetical protein